MTSVDPSTAFPKFVEAIKDLPAWLFTAFAVAAGLMLFVPAINSELPLSYRPWLVVGFVLFGVLAVFKWIDVILGVLKSARASAKPPKPFHATPIAQFCHWSVSTQADGSSVTQLTADLFVKNQSDAPIGLMAARLVKPSIRGEVLHDLITVRAQRGTMHGTAFASGYRIAPGTALPARAVVMIRGEPRKAPDKNLPIVLGISDEDGHEVRVRVVCKGMAKREVGTPPVALEALQGIPDPIEKDVAAVLQSELSRYEKNGRHVGGFGSVYLRYRGNLIKQFGGDSWTPNSTANQEIAEDPEVAEICSDNLDALLALRSRLTSEDQIERLVNALVGRINEEGGYVSVSYFIVLVLWKIGLLSEALEAALFGLSENDTKNYGLSNALYVLNGLLRYRHPDFTSEMLDSIDRFLSGSSEHPFRIPQKIAAIRARRVMRPILDNE